MRLIGTACASAWLLVALALLRLAGSDGSTCEERWIDGTPATATLVMVRHGQSIWNQDNRFTSWVDVPLSDQGLKDAHKAGKLCRENNLKFDVAFTSVLQRAVKTCYIVLEELNQLWIPTDCRWRLNERHDGALTGLNKKVAALDFGRERVQKFRRGYSYPPPLLNKSHPCWPGHDTKYWQMHDINENDLPLGESLHEAMFRVLPTWEEEIKPLLRAGKSILLVTHGNIVRLLAKILDDISDSDIENLDVPSGCPLVYKIRCDTLKPIASGSSWAPLSAEFLGNKTAISEKMQFVKAEVGHLFARDIRRMLRQNDWGGKRGNDGP
ncbi:hypothetical protein GUITHDRAFT_63186 [Guillardia theta CCMP2712]|uniref:Phosphoglycerate mutase n=1 Tax=Guillardia theta (strain CCMP2712) TaxID=905079 RepID=L1K2Y8_GUITC|nr:hypothetical protein GUITHDRAFT_63186 [Guillardia theta CCMP2712]EKX54733.1 hypothetical protein GUITHDRAFT_63186 [Guillardia theta CCMP2712]|eukprot:XP_005841713.1 hypothetical protein GUITHDRAFT_63186 [Guillardia theta CCMP2712]